MHNPVLLKETIKILDLREGDFMIDGTAGSGGHAEKILERIGSNGKLLLVDWDKETIEFLKNKMSGQKNIIFCEGNYADLPDMIERLSLPKADGLMLDLGFSSEQLEKRGRGFSFQREEPLIMTYNDKSEPLYSLLKKITISELTDIIKEFGEERFAKKIAEAIIKNRENIKTSKELGEIIKKSVPKPYERGRIHPATRTFQALRIFLNKELENLKNILNSIDKIIKIGGRVVIISFHSLEDRIVKQKFNELEKIKKIKILNKKPIIASPEEIAKNHRSRSAKLRAAIILK